MRISKPLPPRFSVQVPQPKIRPGIRQSQAIPPQLPQVFRDVFMQALGFNSVQSKLMDVFISNTLSFPVFQSPEAQRKSLRFTQRELGQLNQAVYGRPQTASVDEILEHHKKVLRNALRPIKKADFEILDGFCALGIKERDLAETLGDFAYDLDPSLEDGDPCLESIGKEAIPLFANFLRLFGTERAFDLYRTFSPSGFQDLLCYLVKKESDPIWSALALAFADIQVLKTYLKKGELNLRINGNFYVWAFDIGALEGKGPPEVSIELPNVEPKAFAEDNKWIIPMNADPYERFIRLFEAVEAVLS